MKKKLIILFIALFGLNGYAETIGMVDIQKVLSSYKKTETLGKLLEKEQKKLQKDLEKKQKKLEKAKNNQEAPEKLQKLVTEFQEELQPKQEAFNQLRVSHLKILQDDVTAATKKISADYGIDIVVDKTAILVGGFDLTEFVIEHLNK